MDGNNTDTEMTMERNTTTQEGLNSIVPESQMTVVQEFCRTTDEDAMSIVSDTTKNSVGSSPLRDFKMLNSPADKSGTDYSPVYPVLTVSMRFKDQIGCQTQEVVDDSGDESGSVESISILRNTCNMTQFTLPPDHEAFSPSERPVECLFSNKKDSQDADSGSDKTGIKISDPEIVAINSNLLTRIDSQSSLFSDDDASQSLIDPVIPMENTHQEGSMTSQSLIDSVIPMENTQQEGSMTSQSLIDPVIPMENTHQEGSMTSQSLIDSVIPMEYTHQDGSMTSQSLIVPVIPIVNTHEEGSMTSQEDDSLSVQLSDDGCSSETESQASRSTVCVESTVHTSSGGSGREKDIYMDIEVKQNTLMERLSNKDDEGYNDMKEQLLLLQCLLKQMSEEQKSDRMLLAVYIKSSSKSDIEISSYKQKLRLLGDKQNRLIGLFKTQNSLNNIFKTRFTSHEDDGTLLSQFSVSPNEVAQSQPQKLPDNENLASKGLLTVVNRVNQQQIQREQYPSEVKSPEKRSGDSSDSRIGGMASAGTLNKKQNASLLTWITKENSPLGTFNAKQNTSLVKLNAKQSVPLVTVNTKQNAHLVTMNAKQNAPLVTMNAKQNAPLGTLNFQPNASLVTINPRQNTPIRASNAKQNAPMVPVMLIRMDGKQPNLNNDRKREAPFVFPASVGPPQVKMTNTSKDAAGYATATSSNDKVSNFSIKTSVFNCDVTSTRKVIAVERQSTKTSPVLPPDIFRSPPGCRNLMDNVSPSTASCSDVFPVKSKEIYRRLQQRRLESQGLPADGLSQTIPLSPGINEASEPQTLNNSQLFGGMKFPPLSMLVNMRILHPGDRVLCISNKGQEYYANLLADGMITGIGGELFRTPLEWFRAVFHCRQLKKSRAYKEIQYQGRSLQDYIYDECIHHESDNGQVKEKRSPPVTERDNKIDCLRNCKIRIISDREILPATDLPETFWIDDFSKVKLGKNIIDAIDCWE